jgi:hypothetical protein
LSTPKASVLGDEPNPLVWPSAQRLLEHEGARWSFEGVDRFSRSSTRIGGQPTDLFGVDPG